MTRLAASLLVFAISLAFAMPSNADSDSRTGTILLHQSAAEASYQPGIGIGQTARPAAVIGTDDRIRIADTSQYPFSAVAWLGLYDSFSQLTGACTGTFIGPDAVLTAAHCLYEPGVGYVSDVVVVPGKDANFDPFGHDFAWDIWVPPEWQQFEDSLFDYGVISMPDSTLGDAAGWMSVANLFTSTLSRNDFNPGIVGYPGDKPDETMWGEIVTEFDQVGSSLFSYEIDTFSGQSGSAIFSANVGEWFGGFVVGIHNGFNGVTNEGARIDDFLQSDIESACEIMICTVDTYIQTFEPTPSPSPGHTPAPSSRIWGDPDCNATLSPVDALKVLNFDAGLTVNQTVAGCPAFGAQAIVNSVSRMWADVDCDNDVDPVDGLKVLSVDAGLVVSQPVSGCPAFKQVVTVS